MTPLPDSITVLGLTLKPSERPLGVAYTDETVPSKYLVIGHDLDEDTLPGHRWCGRAQLYGQTVFADGLTWEAVVKTLESEARDLVKWHQRLYMWGVHGG